MKIEPVSMRTLLMPLNRPTAQNALRHASIASLSSERVLAGRDGVLPIKLTLPDMTDGEHVPSSLASCRPHLSCRRCYSSPRDKCTLYQRAMSRCCVRPRLATRLKYTPPGHHTKSQ